MAFVNKRSPEGVADYTRTVATEGCPEDVADILDQIATDLSSPEAIARQTHALSTLSELAADGLIDEALYQNLTTENIVGIGAQ